MSDIRIYVACLAAYNNGYLHGEWIDATQEIDDIQDSVNAMLKASPIPNAEEYAIHDHEGFGKLAIHEYEGLSSAHRKAVFVEAHGDLGAAVASYFGDDLDEAERALDDHYIGEYTSLADYAQELTEQGGDVPEHLRYYIDYEKMARDIECNGDVIDIELAHDSHHLFHNA